MKSKNKKKTKSFKEKFKDNFLYSDTLPATAGKFLLAALAMGPMLVVAAAAPNIFSAAKSFEKYSKSKETSDKKYTKKQMTSALNNLKQRKLVEIIKEKNGKFQVKLTNKGQRRSKDFYLQNLKIKKPQTWDGKWRILIFDIPSRPKIFDQARNALRNKIKELKFRQLQKSAWVFPYECEDEILFIAELYNVQKYIEIITAEKILHEEELKKSFKLF
ncbi:MAG: Repressor in ring oxydation complex/phenylacetic acid degradation pathway related protein (PaaX) [Parcubacteria group bacterium Athens0714_25]|nr:MAG: Repressor in ring oxydation complex/phenylacetic acid degradation pathway related protein (PaaX) [Parcubacteria group bacterium Athens0714_25]